MIIAIAESIKNEIAEKVVEQAHPGYSKGAQGQWYVVNGEKVVHAQESRAWNPWNDDDHAISVEDLVFEFGGAESDNADFDPSPSDDIDDDTEEAAYERAVEFALDYVPSSYVVAAWADRRGE